MRGSTLMASEASAVAYAQANTPTITALGPSRYIEAAGGQQITLTGTGFTGAVKVKIDNVECTGATAASATSITCTSGLRSAMTTASLVVEVGDNGYAATSGLTFLVVNKWSDENSWSGEFAPGKGDSIHIPTGQNLLFDIDTGPELGAVLV